MRNGIIAVQRDGSLALMNDEAYRILALKRRPDDIGRPFSDILRQRPDALRSLDGAFDDTQLSNRAEFRLKDLGKVVGYTLSQVKDDGVTVGAVMFFKDLTQVEQHEERDRLRDRLAALGEMAAGIAHELKNPLAGIQVLAGLLRRKVGESPDTQVLLADIISEAKLANAIVVELLEFVRPIRLQVDHTSLADVLHRAATLAEATISREDVTVTVSLPTDLPDIDADPDQLCQVFTNLLINASEAMNGCGAIAITATMSSRDEDQTVVGEQPATTPTIIVDVADNGPGVPAELTDRIFTPFFTTKPQGSGLGLSIVRKIVHAHDGGIDVSSSDAGTRFRITLPIGRPADAHSTGKD